MRATTAGVSICTQFTRFTGTKLQMLTPQYHKYSHLSTGDDGRQRSTQFTCFAGTKVQILTQKRVAGVSICTQCTCFTGTKVQILIPEGTVAATRRCSTRSATTRSSCNTFAATATATASSRYSACFTGTKVQILTQKAVVASRQHRATRPRRPLQHRPGIYEALTW